MSWNFRVIRHQVNGETYHAIHECYYEEGNPIPTGWSEEPRKADAETENDLLFVLKGLRRAMGFPTLEIKDGKLVEVEEEHDDP